MSDYSIVIPAYNAEDFISQTIISAWEVGPLEVIVVDDGSEDGTAEVAARLNCRVIRQTNQGAACARRAGLALVDTSLVTLLDADDRLISNGTNESLRIARDLLRTHQDFACIIGATIAGGKTMPIWSDGVTARGLLDRGRPPGPPAAFVWHTKNLVAALTRDPAPLAPSYAEDYELTLRGINTLPTINHSSPSCEYTMDSGKSARNAKASIDASEIIRRHYAAQWFMPIRLRSPAEIKMLARIRTNLSTRNNKTNRLRIFWYCAAALMSDPVNLTRMIYHRIRR